jgi:hypothetical protein
MHFSEYPMSTDRIFKKFPSPLTSFCSVLSVKLFALLVSESNIHQGN